MTPLRVTLALLLILMAVLMAAGCAGNKNVPTHSENNSVTSTIPITSGNAISEEKSNQYYVLALKLYRQNLTYPRNRIPENVLQLTDPDFPQDRATRELGRAQLIASRHLIPADQAIKRFNLTNTAGQVFGDQVFLTIYVYPNTSTHILDPVVTNISNRKEIFHGVEAWVDVNNLEKLAAMDGVSYMQLVDYAEHSSDQGVTP